MDAVDRKCSCGDKCGKEVKFKVCRLCGNVTNIHNKEKTCCGENLINLSLSCAMKEAKAMREKFESCLNPNQESPYKAFKIANAIKTSMIILD